MLINTPSNVEYVSGRFFIDIAVSGCGSACSYCYVKDNGKKQALINEDFFKKTLAWIKKSPNFVVGTHGSIISLCPNTEPFKSVESSNLIMSVLKTFLPLGNPIQISTKESIPFDILELAQNGSLHERQIYFNISTPSISEADIIEPMASSIDIRFENFRRMKDYNKLTSCIYIKPFNLNTFRDLDKYVEVINLYKPDVACVGIDFKRNTILESPCDLLYQGKGLVDLALDSDIISMIEIFRKEIETQSSIQVFHSSTCIIGKYLNFCTNHNLKVVAETLCRQHNGCLYR